MNRLNVCAVLVLWACVACNNAVAERFNAFPESDVTNGLDFCTRQAPAACDFAARCNPADKAALDATGDCATAAKERCLRTHAVDMAAVTAGRAAFNARAALRCLGTLPNLACDADETEACASVFAGTVKQEDGCFWTRECGNGLTCTSNNGVTCGYCAMGLRLLNESPCGELSPCQRGLRCFVGLCLRAADVGEACTGAGDCAEGLACTDFPSGRVCARLVGQGVSCARAACRKGFSCVTAGGTRICQRLASDGEPCGGEHPPCEGEGTRRACVAGRCEAINILQSGAPCTDGAACGGDLECVGGACIPRPRTGDACGLDGGPSRCLEANCVGGVCTSPSRAGDSCSDHCEGLLCVAGKCGTTACDAGPLPDSGLPFVDGGMP